MGYKILSIIDNPTLIETAAQWFHEKWGIPKETYLNSMNDCIRLKMSYPQWYIAIDGERIVGGLGVIENDFHNRKDLSPNVCAVYTEPDLRGQGIAGRLLEYACQDMKKRKINTLYLVTDHDSFYERYGWKFLCMVQSDGEDSMSRMYVHNS